MASGFSIGTLATSPVFNPTFTMLCPLRTSLFAARFAYRPGFGVAPSTNVFLSAIYYPCQTRYLPRVVDMMLYQSPYQFFKGHTGSQLAVTFIRKRLVPLFSGKIPYSSQQIYINQFQVIDIVLPFFFGGCAVVGPVTAGGQTCRHTIHSVEHFLRPRKHVQNDACYIMHGPRRFFKSRFKSNLLQYGINRRTIPWVAR